MRVYVVVFLFLGIIVLCLAGPIALITHSLLFDATGRPPWLESALRERSPEETAAELKSSLEWLSGLGWTAFVLLIGFICVAFWWFVCFVAYTDEDFIPKRMRPEKSPIPNPNELPLEGD